MKSSTCTCTISFYIILSTTPCTVITNNTGIIENIIVYAVKYIEDKTIHTLVKVQAHYVIGGAIVRAHLNINE